MLSRETPTRLLQMRWRTELLPKRLQLCLEPHSLRASASPQSVGQHQEDGSRCNGRGSTLVRTAYALLSRVQQRGVTLCLVQGLLAPEKASPPNGAHSLGAVCKAGAAGHRHLGRVPRPRLAASAPQALSLTILGASVRRPRLLVYAQTVHAGCDEEVALCILHPSPSSCRKAA